MQRSIIIFIAYFVVICVPHCVLSETLQEDAPYQILQIQEQIATTPPLQYGGKTTLVKTPFYLRVKTQDFNKRIRQFEDAAPGTLEAFLFRFWRAVLDRDESFLREHCDAKSDEAFGYYMKEWKRSVSINDVLLRRFRFDERDFIQIQNTLDKRDAIYIVRRINKDYSISFTDKSRLLWLLHDSIIAINPPSDLIEFELETEKGVPETNKVYFAVSAPEKIDLTIRVDEPKANTLTAQPRLLALQSFMKSIKALDFEQIQKVVMPESYSNYREEIKMNARSGMEGFQQPILEPKKIRFEFSNEEIAYQFYQAQNKVGLSSMFRSTNMIISYYNHQNQWKLFKTHGGSFIKQYFSQHQAFRDKIWQRFTSDEK
ncbi:hypothetical protein K8I31_02385 [bacterium]|nr:hypothetical protein [bacterium]